MNGRKVLVPLVLTLALLVVGGVTPTAAAESPTLDTEERVQFLTWLEESRETFLGLIGEVEGDAWTWKPSPERWSVAECAEHIVLSERALLDSARAALAGEPDPEWETKTQGKTELIAQVMPNRQGRAQAPQEIRPKGDKSKAELIATFEELRTELDALIADETLELKRYTQQHPFPVFGWLNAHQWLIYVPLHTIRHSQQIREVQESPGYPG